MCSRTSTHLRGDVILFTHDSHTGNHSLLNLAFIDLTRSCIAEDPSTEGDDANDPDPMNIRKHHPLEEVCRQKVCPKTG